MRGAIVFIASVAFVGYIPFASGTFGSLVAIPLFWVFAPLAGRSVTFTLLVYGALVAGACWVAGRAEEIFAEHDSHKIVIDEVLGYLAATLFLAPSWRTALIAFLIFRVFDVIKPFPAGTIDRQMSGG